MSLCSGDSSQLTDGDSIPGSESEWWKAAETPGRASHHHSQAKLVWTFCYIKFHWGPARPACLRAVELPCPGQASSSAVGGVEAEHQQSPSSPSRTPVLGRPRLSSQRCVCTPALQSPVCLHSLVSTTEDYSGLFRYILDWDTVATKTPVNSANRNQQEMLRC